MNRWLILLIEFLVDDSTGISSIDGTAIIEIASQIIIGFDSFMSSVLFFIQENVTIGAVLFYGIDLVVNLLPNAMDEGLRIVLMISFLL